MIGKQGISMTLHLREKLPVSGVRSASMHAVACVGGLSLDDPEDLLRQVPVDVSAVFAMDAVAVTRSSMWSGLSTLR